MRNKFAGRCVKCGTDVAAGAGSCFKSGRRWQVQHDQCTVHLASSVDLDDENNPEAFRAIDSNPRNVSHVARFSSGAVVYVNKRGRCEDAPCCGCCS